MFQFLLLWFTGLDLRDCYVEVGVREVKALEFLYVI